MSAAPSDANPAWILRHRPEGGSIEEALRFEPLPIPEVGPDMVLVRNIYLSIDPTHRIWMSDIDQYMPPVPLGSVMRGITLGVVEQSMSDRLTVGDLVIGQGGWQLYHAEKARRLMKVDAGGHPLASLLGPLGNIGATAYFGLFEIARPKPSDVVVVSAAAGAVGSLVGQMAKLIGCRVVGIVGSDDKARWIESLGFDSAINYKTDDIEAALKLACPDGIDVYFDNVGGDILDSALALINVGARITICGLISSYGEIEKGGGPKMFRNVLMKRATIQGFIVSDYLSRYPEAFAAIRHWLDIGALEYRLDIRQGLENALDVLKLLFTGDHQGKLLVQLSPEP